MAVDIHSWAELQSYVAQLKKPDVRAKYSTVVIDTLDEMAWHAEQHILATHGVNALGDIPYGKGYSELRVMFKSVFNDLIRHYGVLVLGHSRERQDPNDEDLKFFSLTVNNSVKNAILPTFDIMAFVQSGRAVSDPRIMHFRGTERWEAKSRFANIVPSTEFSYENLVQAVQDAVGAEAINVEHKNYHKTAEDSGPTGAEFVAFRDKVLLLGTEKLEQGKGEEVQAIIQKLSPNQKISELGEKDFFTLTAIEAELSLI